MALQGQVSAEAASIGGAYSGQIFDQSPRGGRSLRKGNEGENCVVRRRGAVPFPRVRVAGPHDVAWQRPHRCDCREPGAAGTARGLVRTRVCLEAGSRDSGSGGPACGDPTRPLPWESDAPAPAVPRQRRDMRRPGGRGSGGGS